MSRKNIRGLKYGLKKMRQSVKEYYRTKKGLKEYECEQYYSTKKIEKKYECKRILEG